jgi:hypothetical protein
MLVPVPLTLRETVRFVLPVNRREMDVAGFDFSKKVGLLGVETNPS